MAIDEKSQNSQPMKHKNFYEWFKKLDCGMLSPGTSDLMLQAWTAAVNSNNEQNAAVGKQITELLNTLNDAEKIDCACDQIQIATGYRCGCGRGMALRQAGEGLGQYLRKLRKSLK